MGKDFMTIDTKQLDRLVVELKGFEKEVGTAAVAAINRTMDHVVTQTGRIVTKDYAIKSKEVKESFAKGMKRPSSSDMTASVESRGHTLSIAHFPHSPQTRPKKNYKLKVTIKRDSGRKTVNTDPKSFLAGTGAKATDKVQTNVFRRVGMNRLPIQVLRTLSIPQMITNENVAEQVLHEAQKKLDERLEHEIVYKMTSVSKKIKR